MNKMRRNPSSKHSADALALLPPVESSNEQFIVKVDDDGRTHYAVPLKGPRHKEGQPYLIAHYSMPPPAERKMLIGKLAEILAEAVVNRIFEEAEALHRSETSPLLIRASGDESTSIRTPGTTPGKNKGRKSTTTSVPNTSPTGKGPVQPRQAKKQRTNMG